MGLMQSIRRRFGREAKAEPGGYRAYRGGEIRRTNSDWVPQPLGPNAEADMTLDLLARRVTWLTDNNPLVSGACEAMGNNIVGTGIRATPATEWPDLNEQIRELIDWAEEGVDINRSESMPENQRSFWRELFRRGECGVYHPIAPAHRGFPRSPALDLIPGELLPLDDGLLGNRGDTLIRHAVEFNEARQVIAYHVLKDDPNDGGVLSAFAPTETRRISANDMDLVFRIRRRGQIRGVPLAVGAVETARMEETFHEAFVLMAKLAACVGVWISGLPPQGVMADGTPAPQGVPTDMFGRPITRVEPAMLGRLPKDADVKVLSANLPPPSFQEAIAGMGRRVAASLGLSYSVVARDFSRATFSSNRAEQLEDRKGYRPIQRMIWQRHTLPFWRRRILWAIRTGEIVLTAEQRAAFIADPDRLTKLKPIYPGWEWVDPQKQATAAEKEIGLGIKSRIEVIEERGGDFREVIRQEIEWEKTEAEEREKAGLPPRQPPAASSAPGGGSTDEVTDDDETEREDEATRARVLAEDAAREERLTRLGLNGHHTTTDGSGNGTLRSVS